MNNVIIIAGAEVRKVEYLGQQVVTFAMIDKVHGRVDGTAGRNFRENRDRFVEGVDLITLDQPDAIRRLGFVRPQGGTPASVILVTKRGYLKIAKTLGDDKAWEVFDEMLERYFAVEERQAVTAQDLLANPSQLLAIAQGYALQIEDMKRDMSVMQTDVDALERLQGSDDLFSVRVTAKLLDMAERKFTAWLEVNRWAYRQTGTHSLLCFADKRSSGFCRNVAHSYDKPDGTVGIREQLKFTAAGLARLAKILNVALTPEAVNSIKDAA